MAEPCFGITNAQGRRIDLYKPTLKQSQFHSSTVRNVLYGGAAGGGKTYALRWDAYMRCLMVPQLNALLVRRSFPELERTHLKDAALEVAQFGATLSLTNKVVSFPNGSTLEFGHCADADAVTKYLSAEYEWIGFDELVTFEEAAALRIMSRARSTKPQVIPVVRAATNPGGAGAWWVRQRFIDRTIDAPHYRPEDWAYIPATVEDNPYIDLAEYEQRLLDLPGELAEAYRHGNWDIFPGQYFSEWRAERDGQPWHVAALTGLSRHALRFGAMDWGYSHAGVYGWFVVLPDGQLYLEEEYAFNAGAVKSLASDVGREIARRTTQRGVRVTYTAADPSMWMHTGQTGESIAETVMRAGVPLIKADHERVNGWQRLRAWLRPAPSGTPWLRVHPSCAYTRRTLPAQIMDPLHTEDLWKNDDDNAADMLRYAVMSRPPIGTRSVLAARDPGAWGWWRRRLFPDPVRRYG